MAAASDMCHTALLDVLADAEQWERLLEYFEAAKRTRRVSAKAYEKAIEACDRVDAERSLVLFAEMRTQLAV